MDRRLVVAAAAALLAGCGGGSPDGREQASAAPPAKPIPASHWPFNELPAGVRDVATASYDGVADDLLTGGLGKTGLMAAAPPPFANPLAPTAAELRRNAIHTNYRALVDPTAAGGMGVLYGPNIDRDGNDTLGEGKIAGSETIATLDDGSGRRNVTLMVQVPASFDPSRPCIVTATSSGSRGVYGAIATAGEWGLKRGCAVAYTDKGTGNGLHDLTSDAVTLRDGRLVDAVAAGAQALFRAALSAAERAGFNAAWPHRVAFKHAHSQQNPEADWGRHTLAAVRFAFWVLNEQHGRAAGPSRKLKTITPDNTIVIASSVSNGGGAALMAAEQDDEGLIDGVAVTEPNAQPGADVGLTIRQGDRTVQTHGRPLADYFSHANLYQPCAVLSPQAGLSLHPLFWPPVFTAAAQNRCAALHARGLLGAPTLAGQADEALAKLHGYGWQSEHDFFQQSHFRFATNAIVVTYVNAHGRFSVADNVCGYSMANTDALGAVVPQVPALQAGIFATGNGIPPTTGVNIVWNDSLGGPTLDFLAASPTSGALDFGLDGALCMRSLVTGHDAVTGAPLDGERKAQSDRVRAGIAEVQLGARLRGKPTVIVAGREDTLVPVNHAARAYYGKNRMVDAASPVRYIEVANAQHFDTFIGFGPLLGYDTRVVPLHPYLFRALDLVDAHLRSGAALPPSQVVRGVPRAPGQPLTAAHVPPIAAAPAPGDLIGFAGATLQIPD